jgi:hypothetical protein
MSKKNFRFVPAAAGAAVVALAALTNGCSAAEALCCKDYNPGSDMSEANFTADANVNLQIRALAQAAGDLASVAGQAEIDVANACKNIAVDLGESPDDSMVTGSASTYWCGRAQAKLQPFMGQVTIRVEPAKCSASIQAQAKCEASCSGSAKCDFKANPPKCTGGTLTVACKGECTGSVMAPKIECEGSCSGSCEGTCTATGGATVNCNGRCNGTCMGTLGMDGTCMGQCQGSCEVKAGASVMCNGTCKGSCDAKCTATPGSASVKCSGTCNADYEPLQCTGGKLEGGCQVDAKCEASCNASATAKAECTPPSITVTITGTGPELPKVQATLEKNLGAIAVVYRARGQAFLETIGTIGQITGQITASGNLDVKGAACIGFIADNALKTSGQFTATLNAAGTIGKMTGM